MVTDATADEPCFDGSPVSSEACPAEPPANSSQQKQRRRAAKSSRQPTDLMGRLIAWLPWKLKRRHKKQLAVAAELLIGTAMSGLMAWVVVLLLQRVMQVRGWLCA